MKTYIVADCGINACGNIEIAKQQIDLACACGVDAVKFQIYDTDRLYNGNRMAKSYKDSQRGWFSYKNFRVLADYSQITWFASPFDTEAVELLESIEDRVDSLHIARQIVDRIGLHEGHAAVSDARLLRPGRADPR